MDLIYAKMWFANNLTIIEDEIHMDYIDPHHFNMVTKEQLVVLVQV
jgi:hypothetical protein